MIHLLYPGLNVTSVEKKIKESKSQACDSKLFVFMMLAMSTFIQSFLRDAGLGFFFFLTVYLNPQ